MPRIRTVKPEALQHRKIGRLSIWARWLWLAMVTQADDEGRLVADPGQLRLLGFGYDDDMTVAKVSDLLAEIATTGLIVLYEVENVPYAYFPSWRDHQRIDRPKPSKLPRPAGLRSTTRQRPVVDTSTSDRRSIDGDQGSRIKEGIKDQGTPQAPKGDAPVAWLDTLNREAGTHFKPTDSNLRPIRARIAEGFTLDQAQLVVRAKVAEWRGTDFAKYLRPATLFGAKFDGYLQACGNGHHRTEDDEEL